MQENISVTQGLWGEEQAALHLTTQGLKIIARRVKPCRLDRRCEIDLIAYDHPANRVIFVEVKTHKRHSRYASRIWGVDSRKKRPLLRACSAWLRLNHWHGNFRFDVVEVYGSYTDPTPPQIDHLTNIPLFGAKWRFW